jgi:hypothetical protein
MNTKIPLDEFAREQHGIDGSIKDLQKREKDAFLVTVGQAYILCQWLQAKGLLKEGVEP